MKYIDAEKLKAQIQFLIDSGYDNLQGNLYHVLSIIDSLQQDKEALELEMCAEYWWEERGWIMIPPNTTLKGIESLLEQVKKKLRQERPSLPSDLDEAAEEFTRSEYSSPCAFGGENIEEWVSRIFKAGAEWMAAKFEKDSELTWEDIREITRLSEEVMTEAGGTPKDYNEEILRGFNETKSKK